MRWRPKSLRFCTRTISGIILGKWSRSVLRKPIENCFEPLPPTWGVFVEGAHFVPLKRIFREVVEVDFAVQDVLPVSNHSEVAELRDQFCFSKGSSLPPRLGTNDRPSKVTSFDGADFASSRSVG